MRGGPATKFPRELARILPISTAMLFAAGPLMMVPAWYQAMGDAPRAAMLGLAVGAGAFGLMSLTERAGRYR